MYLEYPHFYVGAHMFILKAIVFAVSAGLLLLIARFADEYFRPYKRKD